MKWRPYLNDRLISEHESGFVVIVPNDATIPVPLFCSICDHVMRSKDDEESFYDYECCYRCAMHWAHPRKDVWKNGWRPTQEQISEFETQRMPMVVTLEVD